MSNFIGSFYVKFRYMKIVLATPLYPPEIAEPAPYVKELAKRLSGRHAVTIVAYTRLPEKVSGVSIIVVDKHKPLFIRLVVYFFTLLRAAWHADIVYAMNGASVELPAALVALVTRRPFVFHIGDSVAHERAKQKQLLRFIERFAFARTKEVTVPTHRSCAPKLFHLNHFLPREWLCTNDHGTHTSML